MKKSLLAVFAGLCLVTASAQKGAKPEAAAQIPFQIAKSDVFKDEYKNSSIISVDEDSKGGAVVIRTFAGGAWSGVHGYYFERYDSNMKLVKEYEYELKRGFVIGSMVNGDKITIVDFNFDKEQQMFICTANVANIDDFKFTPTELFRFEKKDIKKGFFDRGFDGDHMANMLVNEDKSAFAISVDLVDKESETHKLYSFDSNLKLKIDHTFKREIKDRRFVYENIDVSKDGNTLYLLGKVYTDESKKKKEGGKYQYELSRITSTDSKTRAFDTNDHFAAALKTIFKGDKIGCVGFYSDRKDSRFKGLCYFEMDPVTLDINKQKFNPFTEQFMVDKYGKDKDKELKNISFRDWFLTANNEIVFNAEEFYITTHYHSTPNGGGYTTTVFHYDDIVSAKLADSGDLIWARNINKRQATGGDNDYISYSSMVKGTDSYFFINTGEKVKKLRNDRIQFGQTKTKKSNLNMIRIKENGDFDYQEILDDKDNEVPFQVANGAVSRNGESIYFMGRKGKKKQLLKVTI